MTKILYYSDLHATNKKPSFRKDDYYQNTLNELYQIDKISEEHEVDIVICGGDLTHKPNEDYEVFCDLYRFFKSSYKKHDMMVGLTHDYSGNINNLDKSIMGALGKTGVINIVGETASWNLNGLKIWSSHQAIVKNPFFGHHILYQDLNVDADVILLSHIHYPYGTDEVNGKTFVAPGSIARNAADLFNWNRKPRVVIIEEKDGKLHDINYIELDVELDIFDEKYMMKKNSKEETIEPNSLETIESIIGIENIIDAEGIINEVGKNYSKEAVQEAINFKKKVENE